MYNVISIILMIIVAAMCILTETAGCFSKGRKEPGKGGLFTGLSDWAEKPVNSMVLLIMLFIVFLASRLFHLGIAPTGMHVDEMGMAYDAVCLKNEGTDRWGHAYPVYLDNYHTGQSSMYAYLCVILLKFFPISLRLVRLPAVLVACAAFFAMFVIGKIITGRKLGGLIASSLMIITPYFLMSERWALDCNLFLSMATVSMALLLVALTREKPLWFVLSGLSWGLTLYTYIISYLVIPMFIMIIAAYFIITCRKNHKTSGFVLLRLLLLILPIVIMGIPLLLEQLVNIGYMKPFSFMGSDYFVFSEERTEEFVPKNFFSNIGMLTKQLFVGDELEYNAIPLYGAILKPQIVLAIYGLYLFVKEIVKKEKGFGIIVASFAFCGYFTMLFMRMPNFNRYNELFLPLLLFMVKALWQMINCVRFNDLISTVSILSVCICFAFFAKYYYCDMNDEYNPHLLYYATDYAEALKTAINSYDPSGSSHYYLELEYEMLTNADLVVAAYGDVASSDWRAYMNGETGNSLGRYDMHFTDKFDEKEDAVYILGTRWNHISDYIVSVGFSEDHRHEKYRILYR